MQATKRVDIYAFIHKGIRANLAQVMLAVGRMDGMDAAETQATLSDVRALLKLCHKHLDKEDQFVHPAMELRAPGSTQQIAHEHVEHEASIARLDTCVGAVEQATAAQRDAAIEALYRELALFTADNLQHMEYEQTEHNRVLWAHYSDAEIMGLERAIVASIPPEDMGLTLRWMVPYMNPAERALFLGGVRQGAPADAFGHILNMLKPLLGALEWRKLSLALGV